MTIIYALEPNLTAAEFQAVLISSTLGERRPADDLPRLDRMLRAAQVIVTARDGAKLVGISRTITDFAFCAYLSDLAVDLAYQHQGIGKKLIAEAQAACGPEVMLILLAAPAAEKYYPKIGMQHMPACWALLRQK
jgi:GNAT superfamily N-acetyltransferase